MFRLALCMLFLNLAPSLEAATVQRFDLEALATNAERVFVGRCQRTSAELIDGNISTRYLFTVYDVLKGATDTHVELVLPGGKYQGMLSRISGMPTFVPGEEVILFLSEENQLGSAWPIGLGQGKFRIERTVAKPARVFQELEGLSFYPAGAAKRSPSQPSLQGLELKAFLAKLRPLIGAPSERKARDDVR
ncbi:MAG: hypothetical protein HOC74_40190 [Gemmatimonadetes bacterium]|jgi:hypothetical protein|nr:hypothetical protein [Gemmatimonadota bacterium]